MKKWKNEGDWEENYDFRQQIIDLNDKLAKLESIERENDDNIEKLAKLYDAVIINEKEEYTGNLIK